MAEPMTDERLSELQDLAAFDAWWAEQLRQLGRAVEGAETMTPHQKIMRAYRNGTGLRLTPEDVDGLARDGAIEACAANDDEADCTKAGHSIGVGPKSCRRCHSKERK